MLGETTLGTYVAYGALILLLVAMVAMMVRVLSWFSLLWIAPLAEILQRIPGLRRFAGKKRPVAKSDQGNDPPADP
jgi:hypothetical protein